MHNNYDPEELSKFASHAHHWWDPEGDLKTLHQINPVRLNYIKQKSPLKALDVIDVGCGGGILTEALAKEGASVTGIDMNKSLINVAKLHQHESGTEATYLTISAEEMADKHPASFDVVTCLELLEHVPDPESIVSACAKLAKPHGKVFFSTINRNMKSYLFAILGAEYVFKLLPPHTHDYAKFIRPAELHRWVTASGLSPKETMGLTYNPFTQRAELSTDISVNYLFYAEKPA